MDYSSYFGSGLSVRIKGNDIDTLQKLAKEVADVMKQTKGTVDVDDGLEDTEPQLTISVDKEKAAEYGYTVAQVYQLVSAKMADSKSATTISTDVKDYKVYVQTEEQTDTKLDDIRQMTFTYTDKEGKEKEIPLTKICEMKDTTTLSTIKRMHRRVISRYPVVWTRSIMSHCSATKSKRVSINCKCRKDITSK